MSPEPETRNATATDEQETLTPVGVGAFDEGVYRALLTRRDTTPAELATELGCASGRVDRALDRLWSLGLVTRMSGRRRRYAAADPDAAVEALVRARTAELDQVRATTLTLSSVFHTVQRGDTRGGTVELLDGPEQLGRWFLRLQQQAHDEMVALDRPPYALVASNPLEASSLDDGVRWRTIYAPESLEIPGILQEVHGLVGRGERARVLPGLPLKLAIADRRLALLPLDLDVDNAQAALIRESTLLDALLALFEFYWQQATPIGAPPQNSTLPAEDEALLQLLATGLTDTAIGRQLGLSTRTMRRRTRRLFDELAAGNRFQAGVQAARRGWL
ncbi:MAG: helix-turn-helix domain-containing protein [Nocardioidaceae bacterium]